MSVKSFLKGPANLAKSVSSDKGARNDFINPLKNNPIYSYAEATKTGGDTGLAIFDHGKVHSDYEGPTKPEQQQQLADFKMKKKNKAARGMKKGGKTSARACCKGMGSATRGGGYGK